MSGAQIFEKRVWPSDKCWSNEHRCFITRREVVLATAQRVLGARADAEEWVMHPARGFDYQSPCGLLSTQSGYRRVLGFLMQIEYGVYV
ncbi:MbcA/ParS/Xre antitoxin family protein [Pseudomonas sp. NFACC02]|uniref:antitoxin Xre/MbcA/ParS toxin-binding domain-containing protein n=1 Tax=Pseudomonas sp. NFACC02 TaxID=1566250 RepID=UPI000B88FDCE